MAKLAPGDFIDISGHWAENDIQTAVNLELMSGVGTNTQGFRLFAPDGNVDRAQLAVVLHRTFQLDFGQIRFIKAPAASDYYPDVQDNAWYSESVVLCAINDIFIDSLEFKPYQAVTRLEIARSVYRAFAAKNISVPMIMLKPEYKDIEKLSNEDRNAVVFCSNTGIMKGDGTYFRPDDNLSRAELARVINRCSALQGIDESYNSKEYSLPIGQTFTLVLNSNPTTGYEWILSSWDKYIIALDSSDFRSSNVNMVGSGGQQYFKFKALQPGSTELNLNYARPWESVQPQQQYCLKIVVTGTAAPDSALQLITKPEKYESDLIYVETNIPEISGLKNTQVQSAINQKFIQDVNQLKNPLESEARGFKNECDQNGYPFRPYGFYSSCDKYYENGKILSLYVDYYQYTGGAHGSTERRAYNYDLTTGENLALKDLFKMGYDYQMVINDYIKKEINNCPDMYFSDDMGFNGISADQGCYIQNGFLVVYFAQYEIAPYAAGIPEFRLPLSLFADGLKDGLF
jgi:predicted secreted protein